MGDLDMRTGLGIVSGDGGGGGFGCGWIHLMSDVLVGC